MVNLLIVLGLSLLARRAVVVLGLEDLDLLGLRGLIEVLGGWRAREVPGQDAKQKREP